MLFFKTDKNNYMNRKQNKKQKQQLQQQQHGKQVESWFIERRSRDHVRGNQAQSTSHRQETTVI